MNKLRKDGVSRREAFIQMLIAASSVALMPGAAGAQTRPAGVTSPSQIKFPVSDARNIGPNSVRFSAAQFTTTAPTVVMFGANKQSWAKVNAAVQQAIFDGYPVDGLFVGPTNEPASLEIYAKGHHVTNPINLNTISQADITKLIRDVWREY
jgi:hypothetical protein